MTISSNNPWNEVSLSDYENHMKLDGVKQLQALNQMMKKQFFTIDQLIEMENLGKSGSKDLGKVMILGIAGGNGLEYVTPGKYEKVYGVDINTAYLEEVKNRYPNLDGTLECIAVDLIMEPEKLPKADYVIANLLIEYIGYEAFRKVVKQVSPEAVSCVIQINCDTSGEWVSDSPYIHAFDDLDRVHHQIDKEALSRCLFDIGYEWIDVPSSVSLPNGKRFEMLDFHKIPENAETLYNKAN